MSDDSVYIPNFLLSGNYWQLPAILYTRATKLKDGRNFGRIATKEEQYISSKPTTVLIITMIGLDRKEHFSLIANGFASLQWLAID